ncbi:restriction endonuclease subunit S [Halovulum sp. GXIMD14793]
MKTTRLRWLAKNLDSVRIPLNATERGERQGDVPYWGANGIVDHVDEALISERVLLIGEDGAPFFEHDKDVAFISDGPIWPNNHIHILKPVKAAIDDRFLCYFLNQVEYAKYINGSTRDKLTQSQLGSIKVSYPDLETQKAIADFLDRETARIDQLIEKRSKFAELLLERRLAVISKAITGTTDDVPWLQTLPEGWKSDRAKVHFRESQKRSATGEEELLTVSHITGVTKRSEKDVHMFMAESNEGYKLVAPGDLIINTMWAWMGAMGISSEHGLISPSYGVYTPISDSLRPEFVNQMVRSKPFVAEATRRSKGIHSSRLRLYPDAFLDMRLPIPPLETQDALLHEISSRAQREDELLQKNSRAETLLREFRSALITAAVTGQIDVKETFDRGGTKVGVDGNQPALMVTQAVPKDHSSQVRRLVAAEIIHDHRNVAYLGRIKVHKIMFLAEAHANINEINGCYRRHAAGPYDGAMIDDVEAGLRQDRFYDAAEDPSSQRGRIAFTPLDNAGGHKPTLEAMLGDRVAELRRIIGLVQDFSTENTEAIATLYAVWNDAIIDGEQPDGDRIIRGFREEWHEAKQRFTEETLSTWLDWMRRNDLVPHGSGPHTISAHQPSLF